MYDTDPIAQDTPSVTSEVTNPVYDSPAVYDVSSTTTALEPEIHELNAPADASLTPPAPAHSRPSLSSLKPSPLPPIKLSPSATVHTVAKGDSLSKISATYHVPISAIRHANQMTTDTVVLGRKLIIPNR